MQARLQKTRVPAAHAFARPSAWRRAAARTGRVPETQLAALVHVHVRLQRVALGYRLSELAERHRELSDQNRKLRLEFATLAHPRRLRQWAAKLGLRPPVAAQVLEPSSGSRVALNSKDARER